MSDKVRAYNMVMRIGGLLIAGHTEAGYDITPEIEETLIKENAGVKQLERIGVEEEFSVACLMMKKASGETGTHKDFVDLRTYARAGTTFTFMHGWKTVGKPIATGTGIITKYSEKAGATGIGDVTLTVRAIGTVTDTNYATTTAAPTTTAATTTP